MIDSAFMRMKQLCALVFIAAQVPAYAQQAWHWKEYVYERDGFAITLPVAPEPHTDPSLPTATVYTVHLSSGSVLSIRALQDSRQCSDTLGQLKNGALSGKQPGIDLASIKSISVAGQPGVEYSSQMAGRKTHERYVCANGSYYIFTGRWPSGQPQPAAITRIMDSLRLLGTGAAPSDFVQARFAPGEIRPDTGGVSGREYRNKFFGFTYTLPDGYAVTMPPADVAKLMEEPNSFSLLAARTGTGDGGELDNAIFINAWSARTLWWTEWRGKTGGDYLTKLRTVSPPGGKLWEATGPVKERKVGQRTFYEAHAISGGIVPGSPKGFQSHLAIVERGFVVSFILQTRTRPELDRLLASLESLRF